MCLLLKSWFLKSFSHPSGEVNSSSTNMTIEPRGMDVKIELICTLALVNDRGVVVEDFSRGSIAVGNMNENQTPSEEPFILVRAWPNNTETKYNLTGNIKGFSTQFLNQGHVTVSLKEPSCNIIITNAESNELAAFIVYLKEHLPADSPGNDSMTASEPPIPRINLYLYGQEKYKLQMENIIRMNINLVHFTDLQIHYCTLELAGYQVPIAGAIRKMKNLTTLRLEGIKLHSSTFLEIKGKELKQLHLCCCETRLPIASLFKNDLCYKDSLVELRLEGCNWSEIPNGIFQFRNLLTLSLGGNVITELPDKFTKLPNLHELELSHNELRRAPSSIFKIENLLKLSLDNNCITELPDISTNSSKLQILSLCYNRLQTLPPRIFECRNLSELDLNHNLITELPDMFANLSKLQVLSLSYNQLTHLPPSIFQLQNLSTLYLSVNLITELPHIINLPKLNDLELCQNQLGHVPPSIFALQNLSTLSLSNNLITELPDIINLPKLQTLMLCDNRLTHVPSSIFDSQNLSALSLSGNNITELPDRFISLSKLKYLSLDKNQLQYLPPSICSLHLENLDIESNDFNLEIPPSVGSELIVHSLKELTYRTILKHKLIVEEAMLPEKCLKDLDNYQQCVCGCKYVDEGQDLLFLCNLNYNRDPHIRVPVGGNVCTSLKSCFFDRFPKCR